MESDNYELFRIVGRVGAYAACVGHIQVYPHGSTRKTFPTQRAARETLLSSLPGCLRGTPPMRWRKDSGPRPGITCLLGELTTNLGATERSEVAQAYVRTARSIAAFGVDLDDLGHTMVPMALKRFDAVSAASGDTVAIEGAAEEVMEWARTVPALRTDYERVLLAVEAYAIELARSGTLRTHRTVSG